MTDRLIPAPKVAAHLGVKTGTLAKWRSQGKGPAGWVYTSATTVFYPESAVLAYQEALRAAPRPVQRPPRRERAA